MAASYYADRVTAFFRDADSLSGIQLDAVSGSFIARVIGESCPLLTQLAYAHRVECCVWPPQPPTRALTSPGRYRCCSLNNCNIDQTRVVPFTVAIRQLPKLTHLWYTRRARKGGGGQGERRERERAAGEGSGVSGGV